MLLWIAATAAANFVKGLCGFANTLVFTSVMAFGTDNVNISPVELLLSMPTNVILTWRNRSRLRRSVWMPLAALVLLGSVPGALILRNAGAGTVKVIFGATIVLFGAELLLRELKVLRLKGSKPLLAVVGLLSGVFCGLFGVGALLAAYVGRVTDTGDAFKANISAVFLVDNLFRVILYAALGIFTAAGLRQALLLSPFMLAGLFAGIRCAGKLDERTVRRLVAVLLIVSGIVMIAQNVG